MNFVFFITIYAIFANLIFATPTGTVIEKLSGPHSLYFYPNVQGKRILLLGDQHTQGDTCLKKNPGTNVSEVQNWIMELADTSPECLDVFVETDYRSSNAARNLKVRESCGDLRSCSSPLSAVVSAFAPCIKDNSDCSQNLRYHYIDVRYIKGLIKDIEGKNHFATDQLVDCFARITRNNTEVYDKVENELGKINMGSVSLYRLGIRRDSKDRKEFNSFSRFLCKVSKNICDEKICDETYLNNYNKMVWKILAKEIEKLTLDGNKFITTLYSLYEYKFEHILMTTMDVYFIARLFSKFDLAKMERSPVGCRNHRYGEIKNAVIYAGAGHIDIYNRFIQKYFDLKPSISISPEGKNQCMIFDRPFDYFKQNEESHSESL